MRSVKMLHSRLILALPASVITMFLLVIVAFSPRLGRVFKILHFEQGF